MVPITCASMENALPGVRVDDDVFQVAAVGPVKTAVGGPPVFSLQPRKVIKTKSFDQEFLLSANLLSGRP